MSATSCAVDIAGPQKIGMRGVLVESPFRVESDPQIVPDAHIRTLAELPALLDGWDQFLDFRVT